MKNNVDYLSVFNECDSYMEMLFEVTLKGGNKAKMNRFLQNIWKFHDRYRCSDGYYYLRKVTSFIKEGINEGEIPMKFLWNMLDCPKSIDEIKH